MLETSDGTRQRPSPPEVARSIAKAMAYIGNGELAALRRLDEEAVVPIYWRLAASHDPLAENKADWVPIVRALAILTEKGPPGERRNLHDPKRKFGTLLCDGGKLNWPGAPITAQVPRPVLSERRLAQLLAARGPQRKTLLTRAVRAVAVQRDDTLGVNVGDLAWVFLNNNADAIAGPYYQRLDRAERAVEETETESSDE